MTSTGDKIKSVEGLYRRVLDLSREQLDLVEAGRVDELGPVLQEKSAAVEEAGRIMGELRAVSVANRSEVQEGLIKLAGIVEEVMALEDKCQKLCAAPIPEPVAAPRAAAVSMYKKNIR